MTDDLPAMVIEQIPALTALVQAMLVPARPKAIMVLTDRLFAQLPMPTEAGMELWRKEMERYPLDLLEDAVTQIIRTHRWETPPKIGQLTAAIADGWNERNGWKKKLEVAAFKARMSGSGSKPAKPDCGTVSRVTQEQIADLRKRYPTAFRPSPDFDEIERKEHDQRRAERAGGGHG